MLAGHGLRDGEGPALEIARGATLADEHQLFPGPALGTDGRAQGDAGIGIVNRPLDVERIVVLPVEDEELFHPAGDEELSFVQEAQVAGPQERSVTGVQASAERSFRFLGPPPVTLRHARAANPDLTDLERRELSARIRAGDSHLLSRHGSTAAHHGADSRLRIRVREPRAADLESGSVEIEGHERTRGRSRGHDQRALGESVAGLERVGPKAAALEAASELEARSCLHRLRAGKGDAPRAEVQLRQIGIGNPLQAEVISEVGTAADGRAGAGDRLEPRERPFDESNRRKDRASRSPPAREQEPAGQTHIVVLREPEDAVIRLRVSGERVPNALQVVHHVAMGYESPARRRGGARGVLEEGQAIAIDIRLLGRRRPVALGEVLGLDPSKRRELRRSFLPRRDVLGDGSVRQHDSGAAVGQYRAQPREALAARPRWWVRGNGDGPRVQAAEERGDEIQARLIEKHHGLVPAAGRREVRGNGARLSIEGAIAQLGRNRIWRIRRTGVAEGNLVRMLDGAPPQHVHQRRVSRSRQQHGIRQEQLSRQPGSRQVDSNCPVNQGLGRDGLPGACAATATGAVNRAVM